jgi:ADP-ribose pyrophosphatase YjhB (NUDIX family)
MTTPAHQIALWADKLRDMSALGLLFTQNIYDRENYQHMQDIALEMFAMATAQPPATIEPLRATIFARPTPISTGDGAVIDEAGRILLIRRADNQKWAMPGGALAVGETPAQGVLREVFEETGIRAAVVSFVGVHDSRLSGSLAPFHLYHFTFLCRPLNDGTAEHPPSHAAEVLGMQWYAEDALPKDLDPGHVTRIASAYRTWHGECAAYFDR